MKILIASFLYESEIGGGASIVANQLTQMLIRGGHDVVVLTTWPGKRVKIENINGVKVIRLPASNLYWVADKDRQPGYKKVIWQLIDIWNPLIYRLAYEIINKEAPDVFHSHKLRGLSPSIWSAASVAGVKKIIHTCHDYEILSPEGLLMGKIGNLARQQNILLRPYQVIRRSLSKIVNTVTSPSVYALEMHLNMGFFSKAEKRIIPNSHGFSQKIIVERRNASQYAKKKAINRFLYIGRLDKAKGVELLCDAFLRLTDTCQNAVLEVAGWGPLDVLLREKFGNSRSIKFLGPIFGEQKEKAFGRNDVLVVPSLAAETFGIVIAEGFAFGLPAIATHVGAFPEVVQDGFTGYLVDANSAKDLCDAMLKISAGPRSAVEMSKNCFDEALKYSSETFLENYLSIY